MCLLFFSHATAITLQPVCVPRFLEFLQFRP